MLNFSSFLSTFRLDKFAKRLFEDQVEPEPKGWYLISPLIPLKSKKFDNYRQTYPDIFRFEHRITHESYISYLTNEQYAEFSTNIDFNIERHRRYEFLRLRYSPTSYYRFRATDDWDYNISCKKLRYEHFLCYEENTTILDQISEVPEVLEYQVIPSFSYNQKFSDLDSGSIDEEVLQGNQLFRTSNSLNQYGITGRNQKITYHGFGIDLNHSFFYDKTGDMTDAFDIRYNENIDYHRKISRYDLQTETVDSTTDGTYFASIIAGKPYNYDDSTVKGYSGVSFDSKLHVIEKNLTFVNQTFVNESNPNETYTREMVANETFVYDNDKLMDLMKQADSHIITTPLVYNSLFHTNTDEINLLAWKNKEILFVLPAGDVNGEMSSPSDALNALTVGSIKNNLEEASDFTTPGPSYFGAKKPEVVAPGELILGAKKGVPFDDENSNPLNYQNGTYAAAMQVAGLAAQVRQYFVDGYYPTLSANPENSINPTSSLIKSVIINGARNLTEAPLHNPYVGFGIPNIKNSLGFGDFGVRFLDREEISPRDHIMYKLTTDRRSDFSITMNYLDIPLSTFQFGILFADLNLAVEANGMVYLGNNLNRKLSEEKTNTERIIIKDMDPQEIIIHIYSNDYYLEDDEKVTFSLSIFGGFDTQNSLLNPIKIERERNNIQCPGNCSGLGQCVDNGICECEEGRRGIYCQNKMRLLYYFNAIWATRIYDVYDEDVEYLYFQLPQHHTFDIVLSTNWHTNAVYNMIVSVTDDSYGISGKGRKFMFRCDPQHYNGWYGTDEIITKNNRTIILGCYNLNRGESHGKLYIDLHYHATPNPTPIATPTPPATPTLAPTQTPFVTPIETAYETPYKTAFQTAYQTPYYTESFTPFVTPYETVSVTPYLTADLTPFQTVSKTPFETFVGTPFITPDVSKAVTPFITPFTTSEETPFLTASETPYETVFQSPFVTFVSTPSFTLKETAFETAYSTPSSTVSNTPYSTLQSTPSVSRTPARTIFVPIDSTSSDGNDDNSQKEHSNKKNNVSSLVGIIVGCLVGLSLLIVLSVVLYRHFKSESSSSTDIENKTEETKIINSDEETYLQTTIETIPQSFIFTTELDDDDDASTDDPFNFYI